MIVREDGDSFLLIAQADHARLAGEIVAAMRSEPVLAGPSRDVILLATREHDNGWIEVDGEPTIDPETGRPCDFVSGPAHVKHDLWPRGIVRVAHVSPRAGALIAQHALTVYSYRDGDPQWQAFFESITSLRDDLLAQRRALDGAPPEDFLRDYRVVRLGDSFSLQFCNGWADPHETLGYTAVLRDSSLTIAPDPFAGATVPLRIMARRIPARRYDSDGDLRAAVAMSVPEFVSGEATGTSRL